MKGVASHGYVSPLLTLMKNIAYKIGDEFRLIEGFKDRGPCVKKVVFKITELAADGVGVIAIDADAPAHEWAPKYYSIAMGAHVKSGNVEWLDGCGCGDSKARTAEYCKACAITYSPGKGSVRLAKAA